MDPKSTIETILLLPLCILLEAQIGGVDGPALGIKGRSAVSKRAEGWGGGEGGPTLVGLKCRYSGRA